MPAAEAFEASIDQSDGAIEVWVGKGERAVSILVEDGGGRASVSVPPPRVRRLLLDLQEALRRLED